MVQKRVALICVKRLCIKLQENMFIIEDINDITLSIKEDEILYNLTVDPSCYTKDFEKRLIQGFKISPKVYVNLTWSDKGRDILLVSQKVKDNSENVLSNVNVSVDLIDSYYNVYKNLSNYIESLYSEYVITYTDPSGTNHKEVFEALSPDYAFNLFRKKYSQYKEGIDYTFVDAFEQKNEAIEYSAEPKMIWSESLDEYVVAGFTIEDEEEGTKHYTWYDDDCVYYWDDADDDYYMEVPKGAVVD